MISDLLGVVRTGRTKKKQLGGFAEIFKGKQVFCFYLGMWILGSVERRHMKDYFFRRKEVIKRGVRQSAVVELR